MDNPQLEDLDRINIKKYELGWCSEELFELDSEANASENGDELFRRNYLQTNTNFE